MQESVLRYPVLSRAFWPEDSLKQTMILMLVGSWFIVVMAQVQVPMWPVPFTGQTLAVLLIGMVLGAKRGSGTVLLYLVQGGLGLPFFAGGVGGTAVLFGPTAGYLAGFVVAAYAVGLLAERGWERRWGTAVLAMILGNVLIYICGLIWLQNFVPSEQLLAAGLLPFIPGDLVKILLAAWLLPSCWRMYNRKTE